MLNQEPLQEKNTEERPRRGILPRIAFSAASVLVAAGVTLLLCDPGFFASDRAEAAALFKAQPASSAVSAALPSGAPSSRAISSAPASSGAAPQQNEAAQVSLAKAARPLSVRVSLEEQKVTVLDAKNRTVETFVCSSGESGQDTPTGTFTVSDRGKSFYNAALGEGAYYWTRFYGSYLFHSVPFDEHYRMEPEEAAKLGEPASHGCIRLPVEDAEWIYYNIPKGTKVVIA